MNKFASAFLIGVGGGIILNRLRGVHLLILFALISPFIALLIFFTYKVDEASTNPNQMAEVRAEYGSLKKQLNNESSTTKKILIELRMSLKSLEAIAVKAARKPNN